MQKIIVYDLEYSGHHVEYLQHLVLYASKNQEINVHFLVHPKAAQKLKKTKSVDSCSIHFFSKGEILEIEKKKNWLFQTLLEWKILVRYARRLQVDHVILMHLNKFQFILGLPRTKKIDFTFSGILFFPFVRLELIGNSVWKYFQMTLKKYRKYLQLKWTLSNEKLTNVFVLNDEQAAAKLNKKYNRNRFFKILVDPVHPLSNIGSVPNIRDCYKIGKNRTIFLIFGSIERRKGIFKLLESLPLVHDELHSKITLLIVGKITKSQNEDIKNAIAEASHKCSAIQIITEDRFVSEEKLVALFSQSTVILAPYQRTEGSSGILGHAARFKKPVIGPNSGLLGELINLYSLGKIVKANDPSAIARAISDAINNKLIINEKLMSKYLNERTPKRFSEKLLSSQL